MIKRDIIIDFLETLTRVLGEQGTFTEQAAQQIEEQLRAEWGGREVRIWKTSTGKVGRPTKNDYDEKAVYAEGLSSSSTDTIVKKNGISRATLYRLMKRGPPPVE